jgi:hypothetical protein
MKVREPLALGPMNRFGYVGETLKVCHSELPDLRRNANTA